MKQRIFLFLTMALAASTVLAAPKPSASEPDTAKKYETRVVFPNAWIGLRGGVNISDMEYSHQALDRYAHTNMYRPMGGLFFHFQLGKSHLALRPEVTYIERADSLSWLDVNYSLNARYVDARLPFLLNFGGPKRRVSPYLMVAPEFCWAFGGKAYYHDAEDFPKGITADITNADISQYDVGVLFGAGIDFLIRTHHAPLIFSIEGGYNMGLFNTFAPREIKDNPNVTDDNRSNIGNRFFGAELYQGERKSKGIEVALRLAIPLNHSWERQFEVVEKQKPELERGRDTVYIMVPDTTKKSDTVYIIQEGNGGRGFGAGSYVQKDCYSISEMCALINLGFDVSDKRMCLFNINFDFDSYRLRPESREPLNQIVGLMRDYPDMRIEVYGHTDSIGSDEYNQELSASRAQAVIDYLKANGINGSRMQPKGLGEAYPIDSNETEEGRFKNRRVEIELLNVGIKATEGKVDNQDESR